MKQAIGADGNSVTDENLKRMAKELGISAAQLEAAKELWFNEQQKLIELEKLKTQRWMITMTGLVLITGTMIVSIGMVAQSANYQNMLISLMHAILLPLFIYYWFKFFMEKYLN